MTSSCSKFGQSQDQLGKQVTFNYKDSPKYGTTVGGYCSLVARILVLTLATLEIWSCFSSPGHVLSSKFSQLVTPNALNYTISLEQGLPAFYIQTGSSLDPDVSYNNATLFDYKFVYATSESQQSINYTALPCSEVVDKYVSDAYTRAQIVSEFQQLEEYFLCPDTPDYTLFLKAWLYSEDLPFANLILYVSAKEETTVELQQDTVIFVSYIYPFYDATAYSENGGKLTYASSSVSQSYLPASGKPCQSFSQIKQTLIEVFDCLWFDVSGLTFVDLGSHFKSYMPQTAVPVTQNYNENFDFFLTFTMGRDQISQKWTVKSLNLVLGQIGGYTSLLWMVITFVMSGYESHKFRNSLIGHMYVATETGPGADPPCSSRQQSEEVLKRTVSSQSKFNYNYMEAFLTWLFMTLCCCCQGQEWYQRRLNRQQRYSEANQKLNKELNLQTLLKTVRLTEFIARLLKIKTHQKLLIHKQTEYQVKALPEKTAPPAVHPENQLLPQSDQQTEDQSALAQTYFEDDILGEDQRTVQWLMAQFDPDDDLGDDLLLQGITGYSNSHGAHGEDRRAAVVTEVNSSPNLSQEGLL